jgi:hypothetical protein
MYLLKWSRALVIGCTIAAAAACSDNSGNARNEPDANSLSNGQASNADSRDRNGTPITVAGCLQKGDGSNFILTRINEPTQSVGTSGASGSSANRTEGGTASGTGSVEREQLRSAAGAYRIEATGDVELDELVGKEVRVVGTVRENMDLPRANADRDRVEVKEGDLARIEASSVSSVADVCRGAESSSGTGRNNRR